MSRFDIQQSDFGRNGKFITRTSAVTDSKNFSGIQFDGSNGLRVDQNPGEIGFYTERQKPYNVTDYQSYKPRSNVPSKTNIENKIKNDLIKSLNKPEIIYKKIVDEARTLPYISLIEPTFSTVYSDTLLTNLTQMYINSPNFYVSVVRSDTNLTTYQKFIYLLVIIKYCSEHSEDNDFIKIDKQVSSLIEWCKLKKISDIDFYLDGPRNPTNYVTSQNDVKTKNDKVLLFGDIYNSLISISNTIDNISEYLQLTEQQAINQNTKQINETIITRKNPYDKLLNRAEAYTLSIDSSLNCEFQKDDKNNLLVSFNNIDLGNSNAKKINLKLDEIINEQKEKEINPKITNRKLMNIMNNYSSISIKSLLISKQTYKTSLDIFDKLYVVFPGVTMEGRFNQPYTTGTLQISGHFNTNNNSKYWEFVPDNSDGITYIPTTVNVENSVFYITDNPNQKNGLSYYDYQTNLTTINYYNIPIIVQDTDYSDMDTYIISFNKINDLKINKLGYSFLYNKTIGTLQLLKNYYALEDIPLYGAKKGFYKTIKTVDEEYKPIEPVSKQYIYSTVLKSIRNGDKGVILPNIIHPLTKESVKKLQNQEIKTFTFEGVTYKLFTSLGKPIDPDSVLQSVNYSTYSLQNPKVIVNLKNNYEEAKNRQLTYVSIDNKTKIIIYNSKTKQYFNYNYICSVNNIIDFTDFCNSLYLQLVDEYNQKLRNYNTVEHNNANIVKLTSSLEDFKSEEDYYLFNGLFTPDYDYDIEYSEVKSFKGPFITEDNEIVLNNVFRFEDFFTTDNNKVYKLKDYYENENNYIIIDENLKIINPTLGSTDYSRNLFSGTVIGFMNSNGVFKEYQLDKTGVSEMKFEIYQLDQIRTVTFSNVWRRIVYESEDDFVNNTSNYHVDFVSRSFDKEKNLYKTFKIETDLFDIKFSLDDFIQSYIKFYQTDYEYIKTFSSYNDLELSTVTNQTKLTRPGSFDTRVKIKYFINHIDNYKQGLLINKSGLNFNTNTITLNDNNYVLEIISDDICYINYKTPMTGNNVIYSNGSCVKMILEFK